jgi:hypothetical protein
MRVYNALPVLLFILLTSAAQSSASSLDCLALPNAVSDPVGDNQTFPAGPTPDIVCAAVFKAGTNLQLAVTFNPATFDQATASVFFALDTDRNPATGAPPTNPPGPYLGVIGVDFGVELQALSFGGNWVADDFDTPTETQTGVGPIQYFDNGMLASIPISDLGDTNGFLNYVVESQTQLSNSSWTPIGDFTPGYGEIATTTAVPEPVALMLLGVGLAAIALRRLVVQYR